MEEEVVEVEAEAAEEVEEEVAVEEDPVDVVEECLGKTIDGKRVENLLMGVDVVVKGGPMVMEDYQQIGPLKGSN